MKDYDKSAAIAKIVSWSVVLAVLIAIFCFMLAGSDSGLAFGIKLDAFYSDPESYAVGDVEYGESIRSIDLSWESGSVTVEAWEGDKVRITESGEINEESERMRSRIEGDRLVIRCADSGFRIFDSLPQKSLTVYLPFEMASNLEELEVRTVSASVSIGEGEQSLSVDSVRLESVSGRILFCGNADEIRVENASGDILLKGEFTELRADSFSGRIELDGELERGRIESFSSETVVNVGNKLPRKLNIESFSGDVTLSLPPVKSGFEARLDSFSGRLRCDGESGSSCEYGLGEGDYKFESFSSNVDITVRSE